MEQSAGAIPSAPFPERRSEFVLDLFRLEFFERIFCHPVSRFGIHVLDLIGACQSYCTKVGIPFSDLPQCPVDGFFHTIPLITCIRLDQREKLQEYLILRWFVMYRQFSHHHKTCPPHKLFLLLTPLGGLLIGVRGFIKQAPAYIPRIKIVSPLFHKFGALPHEKSAFGLFTNLPPLEVVSNFATRSPLGLCTFAQRTEVAILRSLRQIVHEASGGVVAHHQNK